MPAGLLLQQVQAATAPARGTSATMVPTYSLDKAHGAVERRCCFRGAVSGMQSMVRRIPQSLNQARRPILQDEIPGTCCHMQGKATLAKEQNAGSISSRILKKARAYSKCCGSRFQDLICRMLFIFLYISDWARDLG